MSIHNFMLATFAGTVAMIVALAFGIGHDYKSLKHEIHKAQVQCKR